MQSRKTETLIGGAVLAALVAFLVGAYSDSGRASVDGYPIDAVFNRAEGIQPGAQVLLSGMPVGRVSAQSLDDQFRAVVTMTIEDSVALPIDTAAVIQTDGLLGSKYIALQPGAEEAMLKPGGRITYTQGAVVVQELLSLIISEAKTARGLDPEQPVGYGQ